MICVAGEYQSNLIESKRKLLKKLQNDSLRAAKVLFCAKFFRRCLLPASQRSSTGFCSGAFGANGKEVTSQSLFF
jgi:hypothetical protein